jgi:hypothetical protein
MKSEGTIGMSREAVDQIPKKELEKLMLYIVNLRFPGDDDCSWATLDDQKEFFRRLREKTQRYWPTLWKPVANQNISDDERVHFVTRKMRAYLRLFWEASGAGNKHARDWYIHRAREYYYRLEILPRILEEKESWRKIASENLLDVPPKLNPIERALYHLQEERAAHPSKAPRVCLADDCEEPYFLSKDKGQKFCSLDCRRPSTLASKRNWANRNKGRKK